MAETAPVIVNQVTVGDLAGAGIEQSVGVLLGSHSGGVFLFGGAGVRDYDGNSDGNSQDGDGDETDAPDGDDFDESLHGNVPPNSSLAFEKKLTCLLYHKNDYKSTKLYHFWWWM